MHAPVTVRVIHTPSANFWNTVTARMERQRTAPTINSAKRRRQRASLPRLDHQWRHIPVIDRENVRNTLIEYMITRAWTSPCVYQSAASAEMPIRKIPFSVAKRSERLENHRGAQESW